MIKIKDLYEIVKCVKKSISDEYRAYEEDEEPGILLTVGYDPEKDDWSYQTGDNSFMGAAYHYPHWGVVGVYKNSNCREVAKEAINQIKELNQ